MSVIVWGDGDDVQRRQAEAAAELAGDFTVSIAGPERHDGEKGYVYVVTAENRQAAIDAVMEHFKREQVTDDVILESCVPGVPVNAKYHWNDLRDITRIKAELVANGEAIYLNCTIRPASGDGYTVTGHDRYDTVEDAVEAIDTHFVG